MAKRLAAILLVDEIELLSYNSHRYAAKLDDLRSRPMYYMRGLLAICCSSDFIMRGQTSSRRRVPVDMGCAEHSYMSN